MVRDLSRVLAIVVALTGLVIGVLFALLGLGKLEPQLADGFWGGVFALLGIAITCVSGAFLWKLLRSFRYDRHPAAGGQPSRE